MERFVDSIKRKVKKMDGRKRSDFIGRGCCEVIFIKLIRYKIFVNLMII